MVSKMHYKVAQNLVALRKSASLSQTQLAEKLRIGRSTYSQYEQGERLPDMTTMHGLAKIYKVKVDTIINSEMQIALSEHFLHQEYTSEETSILYLFNSLTDFSKGRLIEHAEALAGIEAEKRMDISRAAL